MRALFLCQRFGWAFHHIAEALARRAPPGAEAVVLDRTWAERVPCTDHDVVVSLWWGEAEGARSLLRSRRHVVCLYDEESWADKIPKLRAALAGADALVCGSRRILDLLRLRTNPGLAEHLRVELPPVVRVLPDGVDVGRFPLLPPARRFAVGWCGNSAARPGEDHKGLALLREACAAERVPLIVSDLAGKDAPPLHHDEMAGRFYSRISAYACASKSEGTPNPPLEALACGRPVLTTDVGIMRDAVAEGRTGTFVGRDVPSIRAGLRRLRRLAKGRKVPEACRAAAERLSWDLRAPAWWNFLREVCSPRKRAARPTAAVAVLVSSGEPTTAEARRCLEEQDLVLEVREVRGVTPMDAAFRAMAEAGAFSEFFVQVDADMLLFPGALSRLLRVMRGLPPDVAIHVEWLWGDLEEMPIQGVKVYRSAAVAAAPWRPSTSCEVDQIARLREAGYRLSEAPRPTTRGGCAGVHVSAPDPPSAFRRWRRLMMKRRAGSPVGWVDEFPARFRRKAAEALLGGDPRAAAIWEAAFLGAVAGLHGPVDAGEADASAGVAHELIAAILRGEG